MNRSILLDILRISAITLVLTAHLGQLLHTSLGDFFGVKNFYFVSLGGVGVSLFLILSGILAGLTDVSRNANYLTYMLKKTLRIYPLYWMSVPVAVLGYYMGDILLRGNIPTLFPNGIAVDLLGSITGMYAWAGMWGGPYNSPSWYIGLIMAMYALFPVVLFAMKRNPHVTILILLIISVAARYFVGQKGVPLVDTNLFEDIEGWVYRQFGFMPGRPGDWFPPCRIFEFGLGVYLALVLPRPLWFSLPAVQSKPIQFLSDLSFPLFLVHHPYLFTVVYLNTKGLPLSFSILLFLTFMLYVSHLLNNVDKRLPRRKIMAFLIGENSSNQKISGTSKEPAI
jgi:peptidoglycan/LPS O-acetylase OafA/YrhL